MSEYNYVNLPPEIEEIIDDLEKDFKKGYTRAMMYGLAIGIFAMSFVVLIVLVFTI